MIVSSRYTLLGYDELNGKILKCNVMIFAYKFNHRAYISLQTMINLVITLLLTDFDVPDRHTARGCYIHSQ